MTFSEMQEKFWDFRPEIQVDILKGVFEGILSVLENNPEDAELIWSCLDRGEICQLEQDDYFGTEGMNL